MGDEILLTAIFPFPFFTTRTKILLQISVNGKEKLFLESDSMQWLGRINAPIIRGVFVKLSLDSTKRLCPGEQSGLVFF